jgi:hypothetical protein
MSATALLLKLQGAGATVLADGSELVVKAPAGVLSPLLVSELRDRKREVLAVLAGERCRYCEGPLDWRRPGGVAFADGTGAHLGCHGEAEIAHLLAAAERVVASPDALADEAETLFMGELP